MARFGKKSLKNLSEAHPQLQRLFKEVIKQFDCSIIEGHRGQKEQDDAFHAGRSKVKFPNSKHNSVPSMAVDVIPYPVSWEDKERFCLFAGYVLGIANSMSIKIRWGGDWNGNKDMKDQSFSDLPHFELLENSNNVLSDGPNDDYINNKLGSLE